MQTTVKDIYLLMINHTMTTNLPLTVNELKRFCELQIAHGKWECYVYIVDDEEGNAYHPCWYQFVKTSVILLVQKYYETIHLVVVIGIGVWMMY